MRFLSLTAITVFLSLNVFARTITFSTGEWEPYVSEILPGYGPSAQVVTEACKRAKLECAFEFVPWKRAWESAKHGKTVGTFLWTPTEERSSQMLRSRYPIAWGRLYGFYSAAKHPKGVEFAAWEDGKTLQVVGVREYFQTMELQKRKIPIHVVNNSSLAWKMLALKRTDIYVANPLVAGSEIPMMIPEHASEIKQCKTLLHEDALHIYFSRIHPEAIEIKNALDGALEAMNKEGKIAAFYKNMEGTNTP